MKRLVPCSPYYLGKVETWINEQASKGKVLEKWGRMFVRFSDEEQFGFRYRLDLDDGNAEPNWERKTKNEEAGWSYVDSLPISYVHIYRTESPDAVMEEDESLRKTVLKKYRQNMLIIGIPLLIMAGMIFWLFGQERWWLLKMMQEGWQEIIRIFILYPFLMGSVVQDVYLMSVVSRTLDRYPERIHEKTPLRKPEIFGIFWLVELVLLVLLWCVVVFGRVGKYENLADLKESVAHVDLAAIEGDDFEISVFSWQDQPEINAADRIRRMSGPFAREHYKIDQFGYHKEMDGEPSSVPEGETGYASLNGEYWLISSDFIAERLYAQLIERYTEYGWYYSFGRGYEKLENDTWKIEVLPDSRFAELVTARGNSLDYRREMTLIFARTENRVIYLEYEGKADSDHLIEALCKTFGL